MFIRLTIMIGLLLLSAICDLFYHKIFNIHLVLSIMLGVLVSKPTINSVGQLIFRMLALVIFFFPLFRCHMIGAGDIKLMSLIYGFLDIFGAWIIGVGFLIGALYSFAILIRQGQLYRRVYQLMSFIAMIGHTKKLVPYYEIKSEGYQRTIPLGLCFFISSIGCWLWSFLRA